MRRFLRTLLLAFILLPAPLLAQRVKLEVTASEPGPNGARRPILRTPGILRDQRWLESLQSSFPLRLQYRDAGLLGALLDGRREQGGVRPGAGAIGLGDHGQHVGAAGQE